jgi:hypothetical protein
MSVINGVRLLLLGLWLGAAIFFSAVVAPATFAVLRAYQIANAGEVAGTIVNRCLAVVNMSGFIFALGLLLSTLLLNRGIRPFILELILLAVVAVATSIGQWVIAARLHSLRVTLAVPVDQLATTDPRRIEFNSLHSYSVIALSVAMIAGLLAFLIMAYRARLH